MKTIQNVTTWYNGSSVTASIFNLYPVGGTLGISSTMYYGLLDSNQQTVASGNIIMSGSAYQDWGTDDDYAWEWAADELGLVITGDYIPPTPPQPLIEG
jgi:hypothetical protein